MSNLTQWQEENSFLVERGIDESTWSALCNTVYPGAKPESVVMAIDYCKARNLDPMLKPVHLVPMSVKNAQTGAYEFRDVAMPGVGLYRIQASRSGDYAGASEPEFGPSIQQTFENTTVTYPEWCKVSIQKVIGDRIVTFSAKEFWLENYATAGKNSDVPNAMWKKRPFGQIAKCAEAQALRKGWPEIGQEPTAEEMAGKEYYFEKEINPTKAATSNTPPAIEEPSYYSDEDFEVNFPKWAKFVHAGKKTPDDIITMVSTKAMLTDGQINNIKGLKKQEQAA